MQDALADGAAAARPDVSAGHRRRDDRRRRETIESLNPSHMRAGRRHVRPGDAGSTPSRRSPRPRRRSRPGATPTRASGPTTCVKAADGHARGGASSWPPGRSTSAASRGARPTPTSPRRSTSASTTPARCCGWPQPQRRDVPGEENAYFYEPRGVAVVIAPWNFPLAILTGMTAAALVTGNTVVMKPAEQSSVIARQADGGLPGSRPARRASSTSCPASARRSARRWSSTPTSPLIAFTGSRGVGLVINRAGRRDAAGPGPRQARHRRDGRQERDHRRRRRRPRRGGAAASSPARSATRGRSARPARGRSCWSRSTTRSSTGSSRRRESLTVGPAEDPGCTRRPGHRRRGPRSASSSYIEKGKQEARLAYAGDVGVLASEGYLRRPAHLRRRAARRRHRPGRDLRPGAGGASRPATSTTPCAIANGTRTP